MNSQEDNQDYLKISEAAKLIGVSQKTVYRWIVSGDLEATRVRGLYFISRAALKSRLSNPGAAAARPEIAAKAELMKCGSCYQIISSDSQIGGVCKTEGCEQVICTQCLQKDIHYCLNHRPSTQQNWRAAEEKLQTGEYQLLVKSTNARQRELIFENRFDARLSNIKTLMHPESGELLNIPSWERVCEKSDEQAQLLKYLRKLFLDAATLARYPLNASLHYRLMPGKGQKSEPLEIVVQALSRMDRMVQQQFDSEPLSADVLAAELMHYTQELDREHIFRIVVLASITGWDESARQIIEGSKPGTAFFHRRALVYLYDLEKGELVYNARDERTHGYADLITPTLPDEELQEVIAAIENEMIVHDSLALVDALAIFPYKRGLVEAAYKKLSETGRYKTLILPGNGAALVRQRN